MRFMEWIRRKGGTCMMVFLVMFVITLFAGLTISGVSMRGCQFMPAQDEIGPTERTTLSTSSELANVVLTVNGRPVDESIFNDRASRLSEEFRQRQGAQDEPGLMLYAYGYAAKYLINDEVTFQKGEELAVKVTGEDIGEAREEIINQMLSEQSRSTGNVLGDIAQQMGNRRERKAAFLKYLEISGLTEESWQETVKRELFIQKTNEAWQELLDEEKALEAAETKAIIDQRLADGEAFADLALEFSEDPTVGVDPIPMGRGLVLPEQEEALFNTPVGELTGWIEIPAGWNRFEIIEVTLAEGEEFEAERSKIVENLKGDNPDYEPTEEEIARQYEKVKARQILLKTSAPGAVEEKIQALIEEARVEVNDPYVLAFQALVEGKLQPTADMGFDELVKIAQTAAVGENYDFEIIREAMVKGGVEVEAPAATAEAADGTPEADVEAAPDEQSAQVEDAADAAAEEAGISITPVEEEAPIPLYAMAIGLFKLSIQDEKDPVGYFPYYIIGNTYMDWLADEDNQDRQTIDREAARAQIEENFARASDSLEYSYSLHAKRGLNQAWLGMDDEAIASLDLAVKYAPKDYQLPVWETLREAYEILDNQEKLEELDNLIAEYRQEALQAMIEEAQRDNPPISIPEEADAGADDTAGDTAPAEEGAAGDEPAAEAEEPAPADETEEPAPAETDEPESGDG